MPSNWCAVIVIVVDASVLAAALLDDGRSGERARQRLRAQGLAAPELIHLEETSVARLSRAPGVRCTVEVLG